MNQIESIIAASNNVLNEKTATLLVSIAKEPFVTSTQLIEKHESDEFNKNSIISNIGVLLRRGFIEKSGDEDNAGYVCSLDADTLLEQAMQIYADANPESEVAKKEEKIAMAGKRNITPIMGDLLEVLLEVLENGGIPYKEPKTNRSNYDVHLEKRTLGVRVIEIRHKGLLRFCTYKVDEELLQAFESTGKIVRNKATKTKNNYIDFEYDAETIKEIVGLFIDMVDSRKGN